MQTLDYDRADFLVSCAPTKTKRFFGSLIDGIAITILGLVVIEPIADLSPDLNLSIWSENSNFFLNQLVNGIFYLVYYAPFEYYKQSSLGKMILNMKVVHEYTGNRPELSSIVKRTLIRLLSIEGLFYLFGKKLWHDNYSDTLVIDLALYNERFEIDQLGAEVEQDVF